MTCHWTEQSSEAGFPPWKTTLAEATLIAQHSTTPVVLLAQDWEKHTLDLSWAEKVSELLWVSGFAFHIASFHPRNHALRYRSACSGKESRGCVDWWEGVYTAGLFFYFSTGKYPVLPSKTSMGSLELTGPCVSVQKATWGILVFADSFRIEFAN